MTDNAPRAIRSFLAHEDGTTSASFSPDGHVLATGGYDCVVRLWDVETCEQTCVLPGHRRGHVAFSPDGSILVSGGLHKNATVYEMVNWKPMQTLYSTSGIWDLAFTPDGARLAICQPNEDNAEPNLPIELRNTRTWRIAKMLGVGAAYIHALAFHPDSERVAVAIRGMVSIWNRDFTQKLAAFSAHDQATWGTAFSPDGEMLATGGADNVARLWETKTWTVLHELPQKDLEGMGYGNGVLSVAFSPDGRTLVTGGLDGVATVWLLH